MIMSAQFFFVAAAAAAADRWATKDHPCRMASGAVGRKTYGSTMAGSNLDNNLGNHDTLEISEIGRKGHAFWKPGRFLIIFYRDS